MIGWSLRVCPGVEELEQWYRDKRDCFALLPYGAVSQHTQKITPVRRYVAICKQNTLLGNPVHGLYQACSNLHRYKHEKVAMMFERFTSFALLVFCFFSNSWLVSSALKGKLWVTSKKWELVVVDHISSSRKTSSSFLWVLCRDSFERSIVLRLSWFWFKFLLERELICDGTNKMLPWASLWSLSLHFFIYLSYNLPDPFLNHRASKNEKSLDRTAIFCEPWLFLRIHFKNAIVSDFKLK